MKCSAAPSGDGVPAEDAQADVVRVVAEGVVRRDELPQQPEIGREVLQ